MIVEGAPVFLIVVVIEATLEDGDGISSDVPDEDTETQIKK